VRLTDVLRSLLNAEGGDVVVGTTKIEGLVISESDSSVVFTTIKSQVEADGVKISTASMAPVVGTEIYLVATSAVQFDSYLWTVSDNAQIIGSNTEQSVKILCEEPADVSVSVSASIDGVISTDTITISYAYGNFGGVKIIGPTIIDDPNPVMYELVSDVDPDSIEWEVSGSATVEVSSSSNFISYVTAGEDGEDIILSATLKKENYNDYTEKLGISVNKCEVSSAEVLVERPAILYPEEWTYETQSKIRISPFHGVGTPAYTNMQIITSDMDSWTEPFYEEQFEFTQEIPLDINWFSEDYSLYYVRVSYEDTDGNESPWSDPAMVIVEKDVATIHILDIFGDGSCVASYPFDGDPHDVGGNYNADVIGDGIYYSSGRMSKCICTPDNKDRVDTGIYIDHSSGDTYAISLFSRDVIIFGSTADSTGDFNPQLTIDSDTGYIQTLNWYYGEDRGPNAKSSITVNYDEWHHFVFQKISSNTFQVYMDGELVISDFEYSESDSDSALLSLGVRYLTSDDRGYGPSKTDNLRIFNRSLTEEEILKLSKEIYPLYATEKDPFKDGSEIAFYEFEKNLLDSYEENNGSLVGSVSYAIGKNSVAAEFEGGQNGFEISANKDLSSYSLSVWLNLDNAANSDYPGLFAKTSNPIESIRVSHRGDKRINIYDGGDNLLDGIDTSSLEGRWAHLVVVFDGSKYMFYLDGGSQYAEYQTSNNILGSMNIQIAYQSQDNQGIDGKIDQLRIFNKALSFEEIQTLYYEKPDIQFIENTDPFMDNSGIALIGLDGNPNDKLGVFSSSWSGTESYDDGVIGQAATFDGNSYIRISDVIYGDFVKESTVSMYVYFNSGSGDSGINDIRSADDNNYIGELERESGRLYYRTYDGSVRKYDTGFTLDDEKWYHIAVVNTSGEIHIYVDGNLVFEVDGLGDIQDSVTDFLIGVSHDSSTGTHYLNGKVDHVRLIGTPLDADKIKELSDEYNLV